MNESRVLAYLRPQGCQLLVSLGNLIDEGLGLDRAVGLDVNDTGIEVGDALLPATIGIATPCRRRK